MPIQAVVLLLLMLFFYSLFIICVIELHSIVLLCLASLYFGIKFIATEFFFRIFLGTSQCQFRCEFNLNSISFHNCTERIYRFRWTHPSENRFAIKHWWWSHCVDSNVYTYCDDKHYAMYCVECGGDAWILSRFPTKFTRNAEKYTLECEIHSASVLWIDSVSSPFRTFRRQTVKESRYSIIT